MNVVLLIPFFLVARILTDEPWRYGPEFVFHVQLNSTAVPEDGPPGSSRLNLAAKLICQPKIKDSLSCHFLNTTAKTFLTDSVDPTEKVTSQMSVNRDDEAYEIDGDQFELIFDDEGTVRLSVNRRILAKQLDMIRYIVGQLSVGARLRGRPEGSFQLMENFTQGECLATFDVSRKFVGRYLYGRSGLFALEPSLGVEDGQMIEIRKVRNMERCKVKLSYYFGSEERPDILSNLKSSDSRILVAPNEFTSSTSNVIANRKKDSDRETIVYEHVILRLQGIRPAEGDPPEVNDPEIAAIFARSSFLDSSEEDY